MQSSPLFAAPDVGTIITVAIILMSLIGWIINYVNEKAKEQPRRPLPPANPQRGADDRFQQEIDRFLQQVGGRPARARPAPARPAPPSDIMIEVVPEEELLQRRREERRRNKLSQIEDRHMQTSQLGAGLRSQVQADMNDAMTDQVRTDVGDRIAAVVEADFGESKTDLVAPVVGPAQVKPHEIIQLLRDRDGVRKAIIVNEILKRRPRR
jgi:hypothetical protein